MKIETKFNIGQEVWVNTESASFISTIKAVKAIHDRLQGKVVRVYKYLYYVDCLGWTEEHEVFPTKEELLKSLSHEKEISV